MLFGVPYRKVQRLITANIPKLVGNFPPINVTLVLRLLLMTSKGDDKKDALTKALTLLSHPFIYRKQPEMDGQIRKHFLFSVELLARLTQLERFVEWRLLSSDREEKREREEGMSWIPGDRCVTRWEALHKSNDKKSTLREHGTESLKYVREVKLRPMKWLAFLALGDNKADFAQILSDELISQALTLQSKYIWWFFIRSGFCSDPGLDVAFLRSNQEEADTKFVRYAVSLSGHVDNIIVSTRGTDLLLLLLAHRSP
ncbi:hypothetical protein ACROYT_G010133 [Oculina patagonica]